MKAKRTLVAFALFTLAARPLWSCTCDWLGPGPLEAMLDAEVVFLGKVDSVERLPDGHDAYRFEVVRIWKGALREHYHVHSLDWSCDYPFQSGKSYLVYAFGNDADHLSCSLCSPTKQAWLAWWDALRLPPAIHPFEVSRWRPSKPLAEVGARALVEGLSDSDADVRLQSIFALANRGDAVRLATPHLSRLLQSGSDEERRALFYALEKLGGESVVVISEITATLSDPSPEIREGAARVLTAIGTAAASAAPESLDALTTERITAERAAAFASIQAGIDEAIAYFRGELMQERSRRRANGARGLGALGPAAEAAIPDLLARCSDRLRYVRVEAAKAMSQVGASERLALAILEGSVPTELASFLVSEATPQLEASLEATEETIRVKAAAALETVGNHIRIDQPAEAERIRGLLDEHFLRRGREPVDDVAALSPLPLSRGIVIVQPSLIPPDGICGWALAASRDAIVVGCLDERAMVFNAATGDLRFEIERPGFWGRDIFGSVLATCGDDILVGASRDRSGGTVFLIDGTTGKRRYRVENPTPLGDEQFGLTLAAEPDRFLVAAPRNRPDPDGEARGEVYLYDAADGKLLRTFENPDPLRCFEIGHSLVFLDRHRIAIGARSCGGIATDGLVFVLDIDTSRLLFTLHNPDPGELDFFGGAIAVVGGDILVAAWHDATAGDDSGSVYLFDGDSGELIVSMSNPEPGLVDQFGRAVASIDEELFAVLGAPRIYVLDKSGTVIATMQASYPGSIAVVGQRLLFASAGGVVGFDLGGVLRRESVAHGLAVN